MSMGRFRIAKFLFDAAEMIFGSRQILFAGLPQHEVKQAACFIEFTDAQVIR